MRKTSIVGAMAALLAGGIVAPAAAANISLVSMQYSASHPVPHIAYEGETVAGDIAELQRVYDQFVHCRTECMGPEGGATAVITLNGPGGDYVAGLELADFLRANTIATVVQSGMECYSACAFAFLGGSAYSSDETVGSYIDRVVEPGGIVGFHAPYIDDETLTAVLKERSPSEVMDFNRGNFSLMVRELVRWNVDPEIIFRMVEMGPNETYNLVRGEDLYLVRTALPPTPTSAWITDAPTAVRNACLRLLAMYERSNPLLMDWSVGYDFISGIAKGPNGEQLSGFRLGDRLLDLGHCSVTDSSMESNDFDIALYMNSGIGGDLPVLSMFNRQNGFSTAGIGGSPVVRIFQKGGLNHWFLPVGVTVDELNLAGKISLRAERFFVLLPAPLPNLPDGFEVVQESLTSRVARNGNVWVMQQVGAGSMFDAIKAVPATGMTYRIDNGDSERFVRAGTYPDGTAMLRLGLLAGNSSAVVTAIVASGAAPTDAEQALLDTIACGTEFMDKRLTCN